MPQLNTKFLEQFGETSTAVSSDTLVTILKVFTRGGYDNPRISAYAANGGINKNSILCTAFVDEALEEGYKKSVISMARFNSLIDFTTKKREKTEAYYSFSTDEPNDENYRAGPFGERRVDKCFICIQKSICDSLFLLQDKNSETFSLAFSTGKKIMQSNLKKGLNPKFKIISSSAIENLMEKYNGDKNSSDYNLYLPNLEQLSPFHLHESCVPFKYEIDIDKSSLYSVIVINTMNKEGLKRFLQTDAEDLFGEDRTAAYLLSL